MVSAAPATAASPEAMRHEYSDISANLRFYRALSVAQITVFLLMNGGIVAMLWSKNAAMSSRTEIILKSAGAISAVLFWIAEEHAAGFLRLLRARAVVLEKQLGYEQYVVNVASEVFNPANAARLMLIGILAFWLLQIYWR